MTTAKKTTTKKKSTTAATTRKPAVQKIPQLPNNPFSYEVLEAASKMKIGRAHV